MTQFGKVLAFDTALNGVSVGYYQREPRVQDALYLDTVRGQAEHLIPMTKLIVEQHGGALSDLDCLITTIGPGSFTGLRLALSAARSYGMALNIPVYGISVLKALALGYSASANLENHCHIVVVVETKRADYYVQIFTPDVHPASDPAALEADQVVPWLESHNVSAAHVIGDAVNRLEHDLTGTKGTGASLALQWIDSASTFDAKFIASHAADHSESYVSDLTPLYLRGADVSQPKKKAREVSAS